MNQETCPTCGCELSNASFAEDGILCMWCGTINKIEGDPMPQPDDFLGPDPEEVEGGRGWYDYDDGSCEKWYD